MMTEITEAQSKFSQLLDKSAPREELVLLKEGNPVAKVVRIENDAPRKSLIRCGKGDFVVPDDFDDPLPKEIEDSLLD